MAQKLPVTLNDLSKATSLNTAPGVGWAVGTTGIQPLFIIRVDPRTGNEQPICLCKMSDFTEQSIPQNQLVQTGTYQIK